MVAHIQADEYFIPVALREQIWSWVECARRKPEWVTVSFSSVSSMVPLTSTRHPEWETAVAVLSDLALEMLLGLGWVTFREAAPRKSFRESFALLFSKQDFAVQIWSYLGNSESSSVEGSVCVCVCVCVCVWHACMHVQSYLNLCNPMDCSPPGSSVHRIFQARILEWVAISTSRRSSQLRD